MSYRKRKIEFNRFVVWCLLIMISQSFFTTIVTPSGELQCDNDMKFHSAASCSAVVKSKTDFIYCVSRYVVN